MLAFRWCVVVSWLLLASGSSLAAQDLTTLDHDTEVDGWNVSRGGHYVVAFETALPVGGYLPKSPGQGKIVVWDVATKAKQVLGEALRMDGAIFSADSLTLATVHRRDRLVRVWRRGGRTWEPACVLRTPDAALGLAIAFMPEFSEDDKELFIPIFRAVGPDPSDPNTDAIQPPAATNDLGGFLAGEATIERWDTTTGKRLPLPIPKGSHAFLNLAYCARDHLLLAGTWGKVIAFDVATGAQRYIVSFPNRVGTVFVSPTGEYAATSWMVLGFGYADGHDGSLRLWRVSDGQVVWQTQLKKGGGSPIPAFSPDSKLLAFRTEAGITQRYDIKSHSLLPAVKEERRPEMLYYRHDGALMTALADGKAVRLRKFGSAGNQKARELFVPDIVVPLPDDLGAPRAFREKP